VCMNPQLSRVSVFGMTVVLALLPAGQLVAGPQVFPTADEIRQSLDRSIPLLELAAAGSASQRTCFTCHSQALPVLTFAEAHRRGLHTSTENFERQINHTWKHLQRGRKSYAEGRGQGGGVDTAGYALWTLEDGNRPADDVTNAVVSWLLTQQKDGGFWTRSSNRPPSEASNFTSTYLALRALSVWSSPDQQDAVSMARSGAREWLVAATPADTEDRVFHLLGLVISEAEPVQIQQAARELLQLQREDGGWSQLPDLNSDAYATGTALYALNETGVFGETQQARIRGLQFLLKSQRPDGSWLVRSRSKPFQLYFETGFPHRADQYISTTATSWATIALLQSLPAAERTPVEPLAGTKPLDWTEADLSGRLMQAAHTFVETQIAEANSLRQAVRGDAPEADQQRQELRSLLGIAEQRLPPRLEYFGDDANPALVAETQGAQILQVRWPVLQRVFGEGLLLKPRGEIAGHAIVIPDASQTPEDVVGLTESAVNSAWIRQLADSGIQVLVPAIVGREKLVTDNARRQRADLTSREWIYRQAFHMGRHVIGYDLQRVLAAADWLGSDGEDLPVGIAGWGEGGLLALHAAAIDDRFRSTLVSGFLDSSDNVWSEPIDRNVWSRLKKFGNAEVAALVAPRTLVVEHSAFPEVTGPKGELRTPEFSAVRGELDKVPEFQQFGTLVSAESNEVTGPFSEPAVQAFVAGLGGLEMVPQAEQQINDRRSDSAQWIQERQARTVLQLEDHVQSLVRDSEHVREQYFLHRALPESAQSRWSTQRRHDVLADQQFIKTAAGLRQEFHHNAMGKFAVDLLPPNARTRKIISNEKWTAYDVVLDVHQGLFSWGVLVVPGDLKPGEHRPVVVCQHGRNGVPRDTIDAGNSAYNDFAARLAERGFVTFAPHNLYRGEDRYRWLDRKANTIGCTLFSFILAQHDATLQWLASLPFVDGERIAFYGLSYGGETAVRVPTILEQYCLSICSGDFNQWTRKVAATDQSFSFMNTIEWEMPYWNLGQTFDYAEMAYLMYPRPFMVERGHHDGVGRDHWVAWEFAKVRWLYAQFDKVDRVRIEFFQGGHSINGVGTFEFLEEHLGPVRTLSE